MSKKILYCASTTSHIRNFHLPYINAFLENGFEVYTATGDNEIVPGVKVCFKLPFYKRFFSPKNISAIFSARKLLIQQQFDIISLHTTLAAAIMRAALFTIPKKRRPKVFYTCHGYLFNENDGIRRWKYLLPEKLCARVTDVLMVMNREDERIADKHRLSNGAIHYINGMGLPAGRFAAPTEEAHIAAKQALGFSPRDFLFIYAAEFSKRKNQQQLIYAFAKALINVPNARLLLAGTGAELEACRQLVKHLDIDKQVHFLGYVTDMPELLSGCDVYVSTSKIEGLPFNIMEALSSGLTVIASDIKGHRELAQTSEAFSLFHSSGQLSELMALAASAPHLRSTADLSPFLLSNTLPAIMQIYLDQTTDTTTNDLMKAGAV